MKEFYHSLFPAEYLKSELEKQLEAYHQSLANEDRKDLRLEMIVQIVAIEKKLLHFCQPRPFAYLCSPHKADLN